MSTQAKPVVAIVGRPNVGKSRLFNRLIRQMRSIVADQPGVTRDRIYADAVMSGSESDRDVVIVDTGGFDPANEDPIMRRVLEQTQFAIDEADAIIFLTDGRAGVMPEDQDIAQLLRKSGKPVVLAVNKLDGPKQDDLLHEFHVLGVGEPWPISAAHGRNVGEMEEALADRLPGWEEVEQEGVDEPPESGADPSAGAPIRVAVIGRPNAGKSSLVNRLLGEDRHLVSEVAGTTVDTVDSVIEWQGQSFVFIDTAGIRRKRSIAMRVERFSVVAALKGLERSDVALLLMDVNQEIANQDAKVSAFAYERGKAVIQVVSKWDASPKGTTKKSVVEKMEQELPHLQYAPMVFTSAHTGEGIDKLMPTLRKVHREYGRRVTTSKLNKFVEALNDRHSPPSKKGRHGRIYYITQIDVRPPRFLISVNDPKLFHYSYRRFLVNELRKTDGFNGVPLLVGYRSHKE
ncbi:MAG: ribosome biogenesis GTPase Der, partial [Myxococcota bacterium]